MILSTAATTARPFPIPSPSPPPPPPPPPPQDSIAASFATTQSPLLPTFTITSHRCSHTPRQKHHTSISPPPPHYTITTLQYYTITTIIVMLHSHLYCHHHHHTPPSPSPMRHSNKILFHVRVSLLQSSGIYQFQTLAPSSKHGAYNNNSGLH